MLWPAYILLISSYHTVSFAMTFKNPRVHVSRVTLQERNRPFKIPLLQCRSELNLGIIQFVGYFRGRFLKFYFSYLNWEFFLFCLFVIIKKYNNTYLNNDFRPVGIPQHIFHVATNHESSHLLRKIRIVPRIIHWFQVCYFMRILIMC